MCVCVFFLNVWREASPPERDIPAPKRMARWWSTITPLSGLGAVAWNWMVCGFVAWFFKEMMMPREGEMDVTTRCWKDVYTLVFYSFQCDGWLMISLAKGEVISYCEVAESVSCFPCASIYFLVNIDTFIFCRISVWDFAGFTDYSMNVCCWGSRIDGLDMLGHTVQC